MIIKAIINIATYLRIDTIEHTLQKNQSNITEIGPTGYYIAYALAEENLKLGQWVIADSVNPLEITRNHWKMLAKNNHISFIEIEIICSNTELHKQRSIERISDIKDFNLPSWQDIKTRIYEPWLTRSLIIDTAYLTVLQAVSIIIEQLNLTISQNN